jgi:hypothetical protein
MPMILPAISPNEQAPPIRRHPLPMPKRINIHEREVR